MPKTQKWIAGGALATWIVALASGLATPARQALTFGAAGIGAACGLALFAWWSAGCASTRGQSWFLRVYFATWGVVAVLALHSLSLPGLDFVTLILVLPGLALLFGLWLIAVLAVLAPAALRGQLREVVSQRRSAWSVPPCVVAGLALAAVTDAPLHVRFALGRAEFAAMVERARIERALVDAEVAAWKPNEWHFVGTYPIESIETYDGGVRFLVEGTGFVDDYGFAYHEQSRPPELDGWDSYAHLVGSWWAWKRSF